MKTPAKTGKTTPTIDRSALLAAEHEKLMDDVARRLAALMDELGLKSVREFADEIGAERSQASNWLNRYAPPPVLFMNRLISGRKLTLDWIYRGDPKGLDPEMAVRLMMREQNIPLPELSAEDVRLLKKDAASEAFHADMKRLAVSAERKAKAQSVAKKAKRRSPGHSRV